VTFQRLGRADDLVAEAWAMSAQTHARQKLLEVRIREARLRAHAGATNIRPAKATRLARRSESAARQKQNAPLVVPAGRFKGGRGGGWMMGGERLDISVRNARSTAAPHKRDLKSIVVGDPRIVKRYFDRGAGFSARRFEGRPIRSGS
jgi:hypothetical protein